MTLRSVEGSEARMTFEEAFRSAREPEIHRIRDGGPSWPVNERYYVLGLAPWYPRTRFSTVTECEDWCVARNLDFRIELRGYPRRHRESNAVG